LQIGAAQADLWRLLVLGHSGGVYLDIDAHIVWPLGFRIEPDYRELYFEHKAGRLTNYFIASASGNPHLDLVIASILSNIANVTTDDVAELTGPPVFNPSIKALDVRPPTTNTPAIRDHSPTSSFSMSIIPRASGFVPKTGLPSSSASVSCLPRQVFAPARR
jgi:mannosyltransferase OCH1-like enzyme